ncbi:MAG: conjugal transfer protein TraR [Proteobacteria bacterium]|nr:conjugal transfer protein TraR [Pseudomonadota bacterium]
MRKVELERFKKIFTEQRKQILMHVGSGETEISKRPEDKDEVDQANADIEQSMRMQLKNREIFTLKKVNEALRRIEDGSYGRCESCDEFIELKRLHARPTTTLCIACKEEEEKNSAAAILGQRFQLAH